MLVHSYFQCAKRWKEIQKSSSSTSTAHPAFSSSSRTRSLSGFLNSVLHFTDDKNLNVVNRIQGMRQNSQPCAVGTNSVKKGNQVGSGRNTVLITELFLLMSGKY